MIDPLTQLAVLHGTDKFGPHDYTPVYHALLQSWRDRPVKLLEIGVGGYDDPEAGGESLATWRDYFPEGQIVGFDIEEKRMDLGPGSPSCGEARSIRISSRPWSAITGRSTSSSTTAAI